MKIIIDPGHGGSHRGAIGIYSNEADINLKISKILHTILNYKKYNTILTRDDDSLPSWEDRVQSAVDDLFISIHCNGAANKKANGIETFHYTDSERGKMIADLIQKRLIEVTGRKDRGVKERDNIYVLKETRCPAVLVECGFITNQEEEKLLNDITYQLRVVLAIELAINEYLEIN